QEVDEPAELGEARPGRVLDVDEQGDPDEQAQDQAVEPGPAGDLAAHRDAGDEDGAEDEEEEDPLQPAVVLADVEDFEQEEDEAADQRHDQRRADGDGDVVGQSFLRSVGHDTVGQAFEPDGRVRLESLTYALPPLLRGRPRSRERRGSPQHLQPAGDGQGRLVAHLARVDPLGQQPAQRLLLLVLAEGHEDRGHRLAAAGPPAPPPPPRSPPPGPPPPSRRAAAGWPSRSPAAAPSARRSAPPAPAPPGCGGTGPARAACPPPPAVAGRSPPPSARSP